MTKEQHEALPLLTFGLFRMEEYKKECARAKAKWPGKKIKYVGTDYKGKHYFLEGKNPKPFIL